MTKRVLVTSGLPYSNGKLHVGHIAGAYLPADIYVRFLRIKGRDVRYVCGSDDHGVAIKLTAEKEGKSPKEVAEYYNDLQKKAFDGLNIKFDVYGATSRTSYHKKSSQDFFLNLYNKDCFEKKVSRQFYDEGKKMFLPDRYVKGTCKFCETPNQNGDQCENCGKILDVDTLIDAKGVNSGQTATVKDTVHWFFDLSKFEKDILEWLNKAEIRDHTRNFVRGTISTGLVKRSITRDLDWGVPVPLEDPDAQDKVLYVWFDAPIGYISNTQQMCEKMDGNPDDYKKWWNSDDCDIVHFIGEDNTIFHTIIWIAMLKLGGSFQLPRAVVVNQFLNIQFPGQDEEKISKSRGTAVWIDQYLEEGGHPDSLRYYLTLIAPERHRTTYKPEDLIQRHNTDLANVLGNFVNRIMSFTHKNVGAFVPEYPLEKITEIDKAFMDNLDNTRRFVERSIENYEFKAALKGIMDFCRDGNKYLDDKAPWVTKKTDMETTCVTLAHGIYAIHFLTIGLYSFLPASAVKMAGFLGLREEDIKWDMPLIKPGTPINKPEILFNKIV